MICPPFRDRIIIQQEIQHKIGHVTGNVDATDSLVIRLPDSMSQNRSRVNKYSGRRDRRPAIEMADTEVVLAASDMIG